MLTPFGIAIRKLRLDKGMRLLDLAADVGKTSAFLSAIETGKKPVPQGLVQEIARAMKLTAHEARDLQRAADQSRSEVRVDQLAAHQREIVAAFARKIDELPPELLEDIKRKVFKSRSEDVPFKRKRRGIIVDAISTKTIWDLSGQVRSAFVETDEVYFPIMDVLEFRLTKFVPSFCLEVCDYDELGSDEGLVIAGKDVIKLRNDVYEGAWREDGRDRFTAGHELGHFLLHREVKLARVRDDSIPVYCDAEWQADSFAGSLLFNARHAPEFDDAQDAALQCGMTIWAAEVMWAKYKKEGLI